LKTFDFDMTVGMWGASHSPGNEQRDNWGSVAADLPGSSNLVGVKSPVVDQLIEMVIQSPDRESLINRTRALDRVLLSGFYVIPNWHLTYSRVAYWNRFDRPKVLPMKGFQFFTWWVDPSRKAP
ncbi:MAG: ABC transporter substrate-binding protein, partial [Alphaproteobacteria bacterium]